MKVGVMVAARVALWALKMVASLVAYSVASRVDQTVAPKEYNAVKLLACPKVEVKVNRKAAWLEI